MRLLLSAVLMACVVRFGLLLWDGYRNGRVKSAALWSPYYERQTQPGMFCAFMAVHSLVVVAFTGCIIAIAFGVVPISN
jgi:hypothetical protein